MKHQIHSVVGVGNIEARYQSVCPEGESGQRSEGFVTGRLPHGCAPVVRAEILVQSHAVRRADQSVVCDGILVIEDKAVVKDVVEAQQAHGSNDSCVCCVCCGHGRYRVDFDWWKSCASACV